VSTAVELGLPFRWDLVTPDRVGGLLDGAPAPDLWFVDELTRCAGKVLARCGNGDLYFVGRSLDSMFDLLGGALAGTDSDGRLHRVPLSFQRTGRWVGNRWQPPRRITGPQCDRARQLLAAVGLDPRSLARRHRPATFVDVVHRGSTFTELFWLLRPWADLQRQPWNAVRRKLRFVGVSSRTRTSPNTFRWQQHTPWPRQLPARAVRNVSLHPYVWTYLADRQDKLTRTFGPEQWLADGDGPQHDEQVRLALAEAATIVHYGRSQAARRALVRAVDGEPALAERWLRSLLVQLNHG
jgi:hypothetical protein